MYSPIIYLFVWCIIVPSSEVESPLTPTPRVKSKRRSKKPVIETPPERAVIELADLDDGIVRTAQSDLITIREELGRATVRRKIYSYSLILVVYFILAFKILDRYLFILKCLFSTLLPTGIDCIERIREFRLEINQPP